jgi:hypothetical protein
MDVVLRHSTPVSGTSPGVAGRTVLLQTLGGTTTAESRADDAGTFVFHVAPGRYRLALDGDGMHLPYRGAPFRVVDGVATTTTVAPLVGGTVAGRITFRGEPVSGIPIRLHGAAGNRTDRTDTSGRYRFRGLPSGDYSLGTGSATSSVTRYVSRLRVVDVRPGSTVTVDQHLRLGGELSARLPAATPRRAVVWLLRRGSTSGPVVRAGRLGAAGGWKDSIRAFGLAPGRYVLQAQRLGAGSYAQRTVTLSSGSALSLGPLRPARRTVTLSGSAAPFSSILVVSSGISTVQSTRATAAGRYRVTGIMRGRYSIAVDDWNHATRTIRTTITGDRRIALHRGHAYGDLGQLTATVLVNGLPLRRGWVQFASGRRTGIDDGSLLIGARPGPRTIVDVHDDRRFPPGTPYYLTWPSASRDYDFRPGVSTDLGRVDLLVDGG